MMKATVPQANPAYRRSTPCRAGNAARADGCHRTSWPPKGRRAALITARDTMVGGIAVRSPLSRGILSASATTLLFSETENATIS